MQSKVNNIENIKSLDFSKLHSALYVPTYHDGGWKTRQFALQGYQNNVIAYRCIEEIVKAAINIKCKLYKNGEEITDLNSDDVGKLLMTPQPMLNYSQFMTSFLTSYLYAGNAYILGFEGNLNGQNTDVPQKLPTELRVLMPHEVEVRTPQTDEYQVISYEHKPTKGKAVSYGVDPLKNLSRVFHAHTFNPFSPYIGMSPLQAAAYNVDIHNKGSRWNISLLDNSCAPSGIFKTAGSLTNDGLSRFVEQIKNFFSGSKNAGRAMVLEEGLEFQQKAKKRKSQSKTIWKS